MCVCVCVCITKPCTSRTANSERYIVCEGLMRIDHASNGWLMSGNSRERESCDSSHADYIHHNVSPSLVQRSQIIPPAPCIASANSPLSNLQKGFTEFVKLGIPASKLIVGQPFYGYRSVWCACVWWCGLAVEKEGKKAGREGTRYKCT